MLAETKRLELIEKAVEFNDELMEKYLNGEELSIDEISKHLSLSNDKILEAYNGLINKKIVITTSVMIPLLYGINYLIDFYNNYK